MMLELSDLDLEMVAAGKSPSPAPGIGHSHAHPHPLPRRLTLAQPLLAGPVLTGAAALELAGAGSVRGGQGSGKKCVGGACGI